MYIYTYICTYKYYFRKYRFTPILQLQSTWIPFPMLYSSVASSAMRTLVPNKISTLTPFSIQLRCKKVKNCFTHTSAIIKHTKMSSAFLTNSSLQHTPPYPRLKWYSQTQCSGVTWINSSLYFLCILSSLPFSSPLLLSLCPSLQLGYSLFVFFFFTWNTNRIKFPLVCFPYLVSPFPFLMI